MIENSLAGQAGKAEGRHSTGNAGLFLKQTSQHPGCLLVHLHALRQ